MADLRDSYHRCIESGDGATWQMQACIEEEYGFQDERLNVAYKALLAELPPAERGDLQGTQRTWMSDRDASCEWDAETGGQGQRIEANSCALKMTATRAAELEGMLKARSSHIP